MNVVAATSAGHSAQEGHHHNHNPSKSLEAQPSRQNIRRQLSQKAVNGVMLPTVGSVRSLSGASALRGSFNGRAQQDEDSEEDDSGAEEAEADAFSWSNPHQSLRHKIWIVMTYPSSCRAARLWSLTVMITIMISSASFVVGSLSQFQSDKPPAFGVIELVCVLVFTVEYILRWTTAPSPKGVRETPGVYLRARLKFMTAPMNVVDLVAILPFYFELLVAAVVEGETGDASALAVVRVVRITRVFRLLKLGKHNEGLDVLKITMQESWSFLVSVLFLVVILQVLFGALIFFAESGSVCVEAWQCRRGPDRGQDCTILVYSDGHSARFNGSAAVGKRGASQPAEARAVPVHSVGRQEVCGGGSHCESVGNMCFQGDGSVTNFNSIPIAMWWALVTMCCVGFGDIAPTTALGQFIGAVAAITGVIVLAMPTTVIGTNFSEAYYAKKGDDMQDDEDDEMPSELKGANSNKNLNRLIVQKQLAASNKKAGVSDTVLEAAFKGGKSERERRDELVMGVFDDHRRALESQEEWQWLQARAMAQSKADVQQILSQRGRDGVALS